MLLIRDIADAVVAVLNTAAAAEDGPFPVEFEAERVAFAHYEQESRALQVMVMGRSREVADDTPARDCDRYDYTVDIFVTKLVDNSVNDDVDELSELVTAIQTYLRSDAGTINGVELGEDRTPVEYSLFTTSTLDPLYDHATLREKSRFESLQSITYQIMEARNP